MLKPGPTGDLIKPMTDLATREAIGAVAATMTQNEGERTLALKVARA